MSIKEIVFRELTTVVACVLFTVPQLFGQMGQMIAGVSTDRLQQYEHFIDQQIAAGQISGAVSLIKRHGEKVHEKAFGFSSQQSQIPMKVDDIFFIQSMTKPIITTAFLMLYEEGHFFLTDPVAKYIPGFKNLLVDRDVSDGKAGDKDSLETDITIAHLLSHTAGFSHGLGQNPLERDIREGQYMQQHEDIQSRVQNLLSLPLVGQPGQQWHYSAAPDVLSVLIEQFSGKSTDEFLRERIFIPLGMDDTGYNLVESQQTRFVRLHHRNAEGMLVEATRQTPMSDNAIWSGVNGLFSTAQDYMKFCEMLLNNGTINGKQYLSRKTIELMTANHVGDLFSQDGVGFGLGFAVVTDVAKTKILGSKGLYYWSGAFNTHFFIDPAENLVAVFMTQLAPYDNFYHSKMRQLVLQAIAD